MNSLQSVSCIPSSWVPSALPYGVAPSVEPLTCESVESSSIASTNECSDVMASSPAAPRPLDGLLFEVLSVLIKDEQKATLILRDAICAEKQWQKLLSDQLEKEHSVFLGHERRSEVVRKLSDMVLPLSLVAEGIVGTITAVGFPFVPLGAAAFGALLFLDTLLDNRAKEALASALARGNEESAKTWFAHICTVTSLTIFGLGLYVSQLRIVNIATNASKTVLKVAEAGTEKLRNDQKARIIENEKDLDESESNMKELLRGVNFQVESVNGMFEMLADLQESTSQAMSRMF